MVDDLSILRVHREEPKSQPTPPPVPPRPPDRFEQVPVLVVIIIALNVLAFILLSLFGGSTNSGTLLLAGALYRPLVREGEYWRLLTAEFLHIGIMHLLVNMYTLWAVGKHLERLYGTLRFGLVYLFSALTASLVSLSFHEVLAAGASGAIFGVVGAMVVAGYRDKRDIPADMTKVFGAGALPFILYNFIYGLKPGIDNWAHLGGALGGAMAALALKPRLNRPWVRVLSVVGFVGCVFVFFVANLLGFGIYAYRMDKVNVLLSEGQVTQAKAALARASRGRPPNALSEDLTAKVLYAEGKPDEAIRVLREALKINPDVAEAHLDLALLLTEKGDTDGALAGLQRAGELKPNKYLAPVRMFVGQSDRINNLVFSSDSRILAVGTKEKVRVWETSIRPPLSEFSLPGVSFPSPVAFSPDGTALAARSGDIASRKESFGIWEIRSGRETHPIRLPRNISLFAFSRDWRWGASSKGDGRVQLWDLGRGMPTHRVESGETPFLENGKFSPDGSLFVAPGANNIAKVWRVETGQDLYSVKGEGEAPEEAIVATFFRRDGNSLALVDSYKIVKVCDAVTGQVLKTIPVDLGGINIVEYVGLSPDARWLAAVSVAGTVLLTNLGSSHTWTLHGHQGGATAVAFSPDGQWLATGSRAGQVMLWKIPINAKEP